MIWAAVVRRLRVKWSARAWTLLNWTGWTCAETALRAMAVLNDAKGAKVTLSCGSKRAHSGNE